MMLFRAVLLYVFFASLNAADTTPIEEETDEPPSGPLVLLQNATVVDVEQQRLLPEYSVLLRGGKILQVAPASQLLPNHLTRVHDLSGYYLMPGLIDTHVHVATYPNLPVARTQLEMNLYNGITTVRDMAGDTRLLGELKREILIGEIKGPDLHFSALMAGADFLKDERVQASTVGEVPGEVAWMRAIDARSDFPKLVAQASGTYASGIKLYANVNAETYRGLLNATRQQNVRLWAHAAVFPLRPSELIQPGLNSVSHAYMLGYEVASHFDKTSYQSRPDIDFKKLKTDAPVFTQLLQQMKNNNVALDATLYVMKKAHGIQQIPAEVRARYLPQFHFGMAITRAALIAGVVVSTGSDVYTGTSEGSPGIWAELDVWQHEAKIEPWQILRAATLNGAIAMGIERDTGSITPGKLDHLIVLPCDPIKNLRCLQQVQRTHKRGLWYEKKDFVLNKKHWAILQI